MESLAFGTRYVVDGLHADPEHLADPERLEALLRSLGGRLEPTAPPASPGRAPVRVATADGVSTATLLPESQLVLHAFPEQRLASLHVFTRRPLRPADLTAALVESVGARRVESRLGDRARALPSRQAELEKTLAGERRWTRARLRYGMRG